MRLANNFVKSSKAAACFLAGASLILGLELPDPYFQRVSLNAFPSSLSMLLVAHTQAEGYLEFQC